MPKTLKDCLLEGGVKGKTFENRSESGEPIKYIIENIDIDISSTESLIHFMIIVSSKDGKYIGPHYGKIGDNYMLTLSRHYNDALVEDPKSSLPIPLPAP